MTYLIAFYIRPNFSELLLEDVDNPSFLSPPVQQQRQVPKFGEHLNESCLSHTCLSLNNDRDAALVTLMNVQHFDGAVESQNVGGVINNRNAVVVIRFDVKCLREEAI